MKIVLAVPFRAAANSRGEPCLALAPLNEMTPLEVIAARFPAIERFVAASTFGLTDQQREAIRRAGFQLVEGDDLDLLARLLVVARIADADAILRLPVESMWFDSTMISVDPAERAAAHGLAAELLPVSFLHEIEANPPQNLDRERPQRLLVTAPRPKKNSGRIALETMADLADAAELLSSKIISQTSPLAEVVIAYENLDRRRLAARRPPAAPSPRSRRVVFVSGTPLYGGSEEFLRETIRWTREIAEVEVVLPGPGILLDHLRNDGTPCRILPVPSRFLSPPGRFAMDLANLRDAFSGAGLVVAKNFYSPEVAIPAAREAGVTVWSHLHAILSSDRLAQLRIPEADLVIGDSRAVIEHLPAGQVVVLPNGVDLEYWRPESSSRPDKRPRILLATRIEPHKGHETLLSAVEDLATDGFDFELAIVGAAADPRSASFSAKLRKRLESGPLAGRYYLKGWSGDLRAEMRQADILVIPTLSPGEPFGRVGIYAMALGIPVIASNLGGPRDYVKDGETGRLVVPGSAIDLTEALRALLRDSALRLSMGARARETVREYDIGVIARRWRALLESALH